MRTFLLMAAMLATTAAADAGEPLTIFPASAMPAASLKPGAQSSAKTGDIVYSEDERTVAVAVTARAIDEGGGLFGNPRSLPEGARLRKASYGGQDMYCAIDRYSVERMKGRLLCLVDADGDKAFEESKLLTASPRSKPGDIVIAGDITDKIEQPIPYRAQDAYPSKSGFRAVIKYLGVKDGKFTLACSIEPKTEMPPGLKRLMLHGREAPPVHEQSFAVPAGTPVDVVLPLCFTNTAMDFLKEIPGAAEQFVDPHTQGDRPVAFQFLRADAQGAQFRLVRPFATWFIDYEQGPNDTGSMSIVQEEK